MHEIQAIGSFRMARSLEWGEYAEEKRTCSRIVRCEQLTGLSVTLSIVRVYAHHALLDWERARGIERALCSPL